MFLPVESQKSVIKNLYYNPWGNYIFAFFTLPWWLRGCLQCERPGFDPWVGKISWRRKWRPTPVLLPGESHGRRSLVGPPGCKELDTTEQLHFHFIYFKEGILSSAGAHIKMLTLEWVLKGIPVRWSWTTRWRWSFGTCWPGGWGIGPRS